MAFSLPLISILMSWISYQNVNAHPFGMFPSPGGGMSGMGGGMPGMGGGGFPGIGGGFPGMVSASGTLGDTAEDQSGPTSVKTELSESCKKAAHTLSEGEVATCANIPALIAISKVEGSIVPAINTWITGACSAVPCRQEALNSAAEKFKKECQKDLEDGSAPAIGIYSHLLHYTEARNTVCTQSKSDSKFCIPAVMEGLEEKAGEKFTNAGIKAAMAGKFTKEALAFMRVPKETFCTPCSHALATQSAIMVEAISNDPRIKFEHNSTPQMQKASEVCGASFDDHKIPDSVQIAAPGAGNSEAAGSQDKADAPPQPKETEGGPETKPKDSGAPVDAEKVKDDQTSPDASKDSAEGAEKPKDQDSGTQEA